MKAALDFGQALILTRDLDPLYVLLNRLRGTASPDQTKRLLLAYWCFYDLGYSAELSEFGEDGYWDNFLQGIDSAPHGRERRHFRGVHGLEAWSDLKKHHYPEVAYDVLTRRVENSDVPVFFKNFRLGGVRQFGPWIRWKIADMLEVIYSAPIFFERSDINMYRDPIQGAQLIATGDPDKVLSREALQIITSDFIRQYQGLKAPPRFERPIGIQEVETIFCKYKAHVSGRYPVGTDTHEVKKSLERSSPTPTVKLLQKFFREEFKWIGGS
jgi:hypothetical protein